MTLRRVHRVLLFCSILILQSQLVVTAVAGVDRFNEANAAYSSSNFSSAIEMYEELLEEHGYAPGVLYNLANSYAMTDQTGKAILNYERALRLAPGDSDISGNLHLVRTESGLFAMESTFSERIIHLLSMDQWTGLGGLSLVVLSAFLLLSTRLKFSRKTTLSVCLCCLLVIIIATATTSYLHSHWNSSVVVKDSRLQVSPFEGAAGSGEIQQGRIVRTSKKYGEYLFVEDETKRKGWLPASAIEKIIPQ